jgi:glucokinase
MARAVGIDVGGTNCRAAVVDVGTGAIEAWAERSTLPGRGGEAVLADVVELARTVSAGRRLPVGVALCELVDREGRPAGGMTVDWRELDVAAAFDGPVRLESDVRAAARAESRFGAGRGVGHFMYVTVGTGISYALLVDGVPYLGAHGEAIVVGAPPVELVSSGRALAAAAGRPTSEAVFADPALAGLVESAARRLGEAVAALVNALDPEVVAFGGGLGMRDDYRNLAVQFALPTLDREPARAPRFVPAETGTRAGVIGAALAARA